MGRYVTTLKKEEQLEVTISEPGIYMIDAREIKKKNKTLCVVRSHRKPQVRKTKKQDQSETK